MKTKIDHNLGHLITIHGLCIEKKDVLFENNVCILQKLTYITKINAQHKKMEFVTKDEDFFASSFLSLSAISFIYTATVRSSFSTLCLSHLSFPSCFVFMTPTGKRNEIASITDSSGRKIIFTLSSVKIKTTSAMFRSIFVFFENLTVSAAKLS